MSKRLLFFVFVFQVSGYIYGQLSLDSLETLQNKLRQSIGIDSTIAFHIATDLIYQSKKSKHLEYEALTYFHIGSFYLQNNELSKAKIFLDKCDSLSRKIGFLRGQIWTKVRLGYYYSSDNQSHTFCDSILDVALLKAQETHDSLMIVEALNAKANILPPKEYARSLKLLYQALIIAENNTFGYQIAYLKNNIGNIKLSNNQFLEASKDFEEALVIAEKLGEHKLSMHLSYNIAVVYIALKKDDLALPALIKVQKYAHKMNLAYEYAFALYSLGSIYLERKEYTQARPYIDESYDIAKKNNFLLLKAQIPLLYSDFYLNTQQLEKSKIYAEIALHLAEDNSLWEIAAVSAQKLSKIYETQQQFLQALNYRDLFKSFSDSLNNRLKAKEFHELQLQYGVEKKERELIEEKNRRLEAEQAQERQRWISLAVVISLVGLVSVGALAMYIRYIRKVKETQERFSQELIYRIDENRTRMARDMHDEIGQVLSFIKNKLYLNNHIQPELMSELTAETSKVIERVREIARDLYPSFLSSITLKEAISILLKTVQKEMKILTTLDAIDVDPLMSLEVKVHLYRIVQELITNTVKHAQATALKIDLTQKENSITLIYQDNGIGMPKTNSTNSFGLLNILERVKIMKGTASIESTKGVKFTIQIPIV